MKNMKPKDKMLSLRLDAQLLADIDELARRLGDNNISASARMALRWGLIHGLQITQPKQNEPTPEA